MDSVAYMIDLIQILDLVCYKIWYSYYHKPGKQIVIYLSFCLDVAQGRMDWGTEWKNR